MVVPGGRAVSYERGTPVRKEAGESGGGMERASRAEDSAEVQKSFPAQIRLLVFYHC